jgi:hypothetical protein
MPKKKHTHTYIYINIQIHARTHTHTHTRTHTHTHTHTQGNRVVPLSDQESELAHGGSTEGIYHFVGRCVFMCSYVFLLSRVRVSSWRQC